MLLSASAVSYIHLEDWRPIVRWVGMESLPEKHFQHMPDLFNTFANALEHWKVRNTGIKRIEISITSFNFNYCFLNKSRNPSKRRNKWDELAVNNHEARTASLQELRLIVQLLDFSFGFFQWTHVHFYLMWLECQKKWAQFVLRTVINLPPGKLRKHCSILKKESGLLFPH